MTTETTALDPQHDTIIKAGGRLWEKYGKRRYYLDTEQVYGLELSHYKTGNISNASLNGNGISNSSARRIQGKLAGVKVFFDLDANEWVVTGTWDRDLKAELLDAARRITDTTTNSTVAGGQPC